MPRRRLLTLLVTLSLFLPALHARSASNPQCFTGTPNIVDCLSGRFAQYWDESGGLPVFGYPITPAYDAPVRSGSILAQMVERNRLEYHAELSPPYDVLLGRLGEDLLQARGRDWRREPAGTPQPGCRFATETRHTICDQEPGLGFLTYYHSHGLDMGDPGISERESLALWGLPLTEPALETNQAGDTVLTQWFERARFEYHPDRPPEYRVLLGLLGREFWGANARPKPSFQSVPAALGDQQREPVLQPPLAPPAATNAPTVTPKPTDRPTATVSPTTPATATASPTPPRSVEATATRTSIPTAENDAASDTELKQRLFGLVDMYHQQAGCPAFVPDERLAQAAQGHAEDIASHKRIDHVGTDGATLRERIARTGFPFDRASEGIAVYKTPEIAVDFWMDEPPDGPHRQNITNCQYTDIGLGLAYDDRGWRWWVMDVAHRRPAP